MQFVIHCAIKMFITFVVAHELLKEDWRSPRNLGSMAKTFPSHYPDDGSSWDCKSLEIWNYYFIESRKLP